MPLSLKTLTKVSEPYWFASAVLGLTALRLLHFGEYIDEPHSFRQSDTANYAWDFYRNGIDLLAPSVCWLGAHKTLILEFPLPQALIALLYKAFGPDLVWARSVTLLFFLGSAYYLHRLVSYLSGSNLARIATVVYLALPLGLYYSRAVHVDFAAVFFAHAMLYYLMRGVGENRPLLICTGVLLATLGFLIKAPYLFYLFLPLAWYAWKIGRFRQSLKWLPLLIAPCGSFILWRLHAEAINEAAPAWEFIPGYFKFVDMGFWYYGTLEQRWDPQVWRSLGLGLTFEIATPPGLLLLLAGLFLKFDVRQAAFFKIWLLGALVYLLIFFNLNYVHNYYQIPFLAPSACLIAVAICGIFRKSAFIGKPVTATALILIIAAAVAHAEKNYYKLDWPKIEAGRIVQENTPEDALLIASMADMGAQDPTLLYRARRNGWPIRLAALQPALIARLEDNGADFLAVVTEPAAKAAFPDFLVQLPRQTYRLDPNWNLYLYPLDNGQLSR